MSVDYLLFDVINGLAGHYRWLDQCAQWLVIYGVLALALLALALLWWPKFNTEQHKSFLLLLCITSAICAFFLVLEWLITTYVLHHELRSRPFNARWTTVLVAVETTLSFPAWPVVFATIFAILMLRVAKILGIICLTIACLIGFACILTGINYPIDVLTAVLLGFVVVITSAFFVIKSSNNSLRWRWVVLSWVGLCLWGMVIYLTVPPTHLEIERPAGTGMTQLSQVTVPLRLTNALTQYGAPGKITVQAATNKHVLVGYIHVLLPSAHVSLQSVEQQARNLTNITFANWRQLQLVTIEISASFPRQHQKTGSLFTATIARSQWPIDGYTDVDKLPGGKFFHQQFYTVSKSRTE